MSIKLVSFFLLMCVAFATENEYVEETLLQLKHVLEQKRETLQKREHDVNAAEESLRAREEKFRETQEENFNQMEQRAQTLQKLEATLQKREQNIMAAEMKLRKAKEKFYAEKQTLQKQREFAQEENILSYDENMCKSEKPKENQETMSKILAPCNLFPNESGIKVFHDAEKDAYFWEDSKSLIRNDIKEQIVLSLRQKGEAMSNDLFFLISDLYVPTGARPFVKELIFEMSKNIEVGKKNERNETPLMLAAYFNQAKAVAKFIEQGADIELANNIGDTAIHWGATSGSRSSCKILLEKGANANVPNKSGDTALMAAAMNGHAEVVRLLLKSGADTKIKNKTRLTALDYATQSCADVIKAHEATLQKNTRAKERSSIQNSLQKPFAREKSTHSKYTNMREREKPKEKLQTTSNIILSSIFSNESSVKVFRNTETNVFSWEDPHGSIEENIKRKIESSLTQKGSAMANGLFNCVCSWNSPQKINPFVKEILSVMAEDVDIDKRDQYNKTPMMLSAKYDSEGAIVKLLERNAKLESVDEDGNTALHRASYYSSRSCCEALLENGADVDAQNIFGNTPLMNSVANGNVEIVKLILESGADITVTNKRGMTALDYSEPNRADAIQDAFRAHTILNKQRVQKKILRSKDKNTCGREKPKEIDISWGKISEPLNLFPNESSIKVFRSLETNEIFWEDPKNLISKKKKEKIEASLQQKGEAMANGLFDCFSSFTAEAMAKPFVKELLFSMSKHINIDKRSEHDQTPIMLAVKFDAEKAVVKLIEKSVVKMLENVDEYGLTALDLAAYFGSRSSCSILLQNGANVNNQSKNSLWTPLMFATKWGKNVDVIKLLLQFGADSAVQNKSGKTALDYAEPNCAQVIREHESKLIN